jgi:predicted metal-dependent phosphoesterase TrpH
MHTKFSDGTDDIRELIEKVIDSGIKYFSITDHDTIDGVNTLLSDKVLCDKLQSNNIKFVTGVEFSSVANGDKIHLIGYKYDPCCKSINEAVEIAIKKRISKFRVRLEALKDQKGIKYRLQSIDEMKKSEFIGKPIMAKYLVKDGLCSSIDDAFDILNNLKTKATETRVDAEIIVPAIVNSGGICVWAHPLGGINEKRISFEKVEEIIKKLIPLGLKGIECFYNLYSHEEKDRLVGIANKYGLLISAGSDYHGKNKKASVGEVLNLQRYDSYKDSTIINYIFN